MPLGTLDRTPPPFFRQGASALSRLMLFSALALFLMVADTRFKLTGPIRVTIASVLYPVQWALVQPVLWTRDVFGNLQSLRSAQDDAQLLREQLRLQSPRAQQYEQLALENERLRQLLDLRQRMPTPGLAAQVLYDAADPYEHKIVIDKGLIHGINTGAPVLDESGVLGQVTRVYPLIAEVSLLVDRDQAIPVLDVRSGVRSVAYGEPASDGDGLALRYTLAETDIREGDLLTTSGVDAVYPPGLPVARVSVVERQSGSSFMRIRAEPLARMDGALHVLVLEPTGAPPPEPPAAAPASAPAPGKVGGQGRTP